MTANQTIRVRIRDLILSAGLALTLGACGTDTPMNQLPAEVKRVTINSNVGPTRVLAVDPQWQSLFKTVQNEGELDEEQLIYAEEGGEIGIGNEEMGYCRLRFKENDLPGDVRIKIEWRQSESNDLILYDLEFHPHGLQFNQPVELELSYKHANLTNVSEDALGVYYFNEEAGSWEFIGGRVDKAAKTVSVNLHHFSRYAVGWPELRAE